MKKTTLLSMALTMATMAFAQTLPAGYTQTIENGRAVLRDATGEIMAWLDQPIDNQDIPAEFINFLDFHEEGLRRINAGAMEEDVYLTKSVRNAKSSAAKAPAATPDTIGPLLGNIRYHQNAPYNNNCPNKAVTGCVATAMSQIMCYYHYPDCGTGSAKYTTLSGETTFNFDTHPFDWDLIKDNYEGSFTNAQAAAVANLCLAAGAAVNMNYSRDGSGANSENVAPAMKTYFGFSEDATFVSSTKPDYENDWIYTLEEDLDNGYPIYYAGSQGSSFTGHAFLIDGYTISNTGTTNVQRYWFHLNWGWGGSMNGYYRINKLQPETDNYSGYRNEMIFSLYPANMTDIEGVTTTNTASKKIENGQIIIEKNGKRYSVVGTLVK